MHVNGSGWHMKNDLIFDKIAELATIFHNQMCVFQNYTDTLATFHHKKDLCFFSDFITALAVIHVLDMFLF